jgi:hypothetical protein
MMNGIFCNKKSRNIQKIHETNGWENVMFDDEFDNVKNPLKNSLSKY